MKRNILMLTVIFGDELGWSYERVNQSYGSYIEKIEEIDDIKEFAETLTEERMQVWTGRKEISEETGQPMSEIPEWLLDEGEEGEISNDEYSKFLYTLMFNAMTIAWKRMIKYQIRVGEEEEESFDEDDLDEYKGLVGVDEDGVITNELYNNHRMFVQNDIFDYNGVYVGQDKEQFEKQQRWDEETKKWERLRKTDKEKR